MAHQPTRNSLYSTDSTTAYASTLSCLTSSLGLTESPLPPGKKTMAVLEAVRDQSGDYRRQAILQGQRSRGDLRAGGGVTSRVQSFENIRREAGAQPVVMVSSPGRTRAAPTRSLEGNPGTERPTSQLRAQHYSAQLKAGQPAQLSQSAPRVRAGQAPNPSPTVTLPPSKSQVAIPVRRVHQNQHPSSLHPPPLGQPPASPARTEDSMADDWDAELRKDAQTAKLQFRPQNEGAVVLSQQVVAVKPVRDEWEMAAMRIDRRETGRDAEENTRRESTRQIAYPPSMPRLAIRAAPTGVTSIHVGVRPRIHPTRTEESLSRNQPDINLPDPLFSPSHTSSAPLASPSDIGSGNEYEATVRGSYGNKYTGELAEKARKEYEDWLARKADREGMRGPDGGLGGAQEWEPRDRTRARFGELNQPVSAHPDRNFAAAQLGMGMIPGEGQYGYGHAPSQDLGYGTAGYPIAGQHLIEAPIIIQAKGQPLGPEDPQLQGYEGYGQTGYPYQQQGYWDPMAYWWAMAQMQMQMQGMSMEDIQAYGMQMQMGMQGDGVSPITSEESSQGSSDDGQPPRIHFAPSPKKDKGRSKRQESDAEIYQQQLQQAQLYQQQYGQEVYDARMKRKMVHWGMTPPGQYSELPSGEMGMSIGGMPAMGMGGMMGQGAMGQAYPQPQNMSYGGVGFGLGGGGMGQVHQGMYGMPMGGQMGGYGGGMPMSGGGGGGGYGGYGANPGMSMGGGMVNMVGSGALPPPEGMKIPGQRPRNNFGAAGLGMGMNPGRGGGGSGLTSGLVDFFFRLSFVDPPPSVVILLDVLLFSLLPATSAF